ncbi:MAG TPA: DUF6152 family protein [Vicinamibacterales bacterium]|nr:DUF6152 family protein [Vicinamibacterales bacterium]
MKAVAFVAMMSAAAPVFAHHSAAGIDRSKTVTLVGTVKQFGWQNPHSWMEVDVSNESGGVTTWKVEMTSPAFLIRAGWKSTTVKPGDKVTVKVFPLRGGDPGGLFQSVTLADGSTLTERAAIGGRQ